MYGFWIDESLKEVTDPSQKPLIAVGGFYIPILESQYCISAWQALKRTFGIDEDSEIKWNLPKKHPTRIEIEQKQIDYWKFRKSALELLESWQFFFCVVSILKDKRDRCLWQWDRIRPSCVDLYSECLKYSLQRVAEESCDSKWMYCLVISDRFSTGKGKIEIGAVRKGPNIIQEYYNRLYREGVGGGPNSLYENHTLKNLNFYPSILMSDATYDDLIQIADFVVSCTADWVFDTLYNTKKTFSTECMKILAPRFRNVSQTTFGFFKDGFNPYPFDDEEILKLKLSLE